MASINITLKSGATQREISQNIKAQVLQELRPKVRQALTQAASSIRSGMTRLIAERIEASAEYHAMQPGGNLYGQLGVIDINSAIVQIIRQISVSTDIKINPVRVVGGSIEGNIIVSILKDDYSDLLSLNAAHFVSESGSEVEWLRYLLLEGASTVFQYFAYSGRFTDKIFRRSRTGTGIMFGVRNVTGWSVPAEYAGTANDNWLTRALADLDEVIATEMALQLRRLA